MSSPVTSPHATTARDVRRSWDDVMSDWEFASTDTSSDLLMEAKARHARGEWAHVRRLVARIEADPAAHTATREAAKGLVATLQADPANLVALVCAMLLVVAVFFRAVGH